MEQSCLVSASTAPMTLDHQDDHQLWDRAGRKVPCHVIALLLPLRGKVPVSAWQIACRDFTRLIRLVARWIFIDMGRSEQDSHTQLIME